METVLAFFYKALECLGHLRPNQMSTCKTWAGQQWRAALQMLIYALTYISWHYCFLKSPDPMVGVKESLPCCSSEKQQNNPQCPFPQTSFTITTTEQAHELEVKYRDHSRTRGSANQYSYMVVHFVFARLK